MPGAAVTASNVSRLFELGSEEVWAVRDVSLEVEPGEFLALIGRSGSGKTTLLNIIAGLDKPTSGEVTIDGTRVDLMSEGDLVQLRRTTLGFIFQSFGLLPLLSAQENVELPLRIAGYSNRDRVKRAKEVIAMVGLTKRADHRPYELSGGEQQRVAIARALATAPRLMLADEPTGELDSATATAVFTLMRDIAREEGITIITCTHDRLVMEMADRVQELSGGQLVDGQHGEVWGRVQTRERSAFAAPRTEEEAAAVSSLIGADTSIFVPRTGNDAAPAPTPTTPARSVAEERTPEPVVEAEVEAAPDPEVARDTEPVPEPESEDDITRWAPPSR